MATARSVSASNGRLASHDAPPDRLEMSVGDMTFDGLQWGSVDGELVLLLHGFPQSAEAWTEVGGRIGAKGFHVVAPNQRGYSEGARPSHASAYQLDELVADALAMIDELGADRAHVVGHDWGGVVAWALAAMHPERVRTLTVLSTPHPRALARSLSRSLQPLRSAYVGLFSVPFLPERLLTVGSGGLLRRLLVRSGLPEAYAAVYANALGTPSALGAALSWYRASTWRGGRLSTVGAVTVPTTYVWGTADVALGAAAAKATEAEVTGPYRFVVLDGAGHWLPEAHPEIPDLVLESLRAR